MSQLVMEMWKYVKNFVKIVFKNTLDMKKKVLTFVYSSLHLYFSTHIIILDETFLKYSPLHNRVLNVVSGMLYLC